MAKRAALIFLVFFQVFLLRAQTSGDSSRISDTVPSRPVETDTTAEKPVIKKRIRLAPDSLQNSKLISDSPVIFFTDSLRYSTVRPRTPGSLPVTFSEILKAHPGFNLSGKALHIRADKYEPSSYDGMFYLLVSMLFYLAIVRLFFAKYLANLMTLFFRASMRQQQLREQVLQSPFPSLLLNILFLFSGGLYAAFMLRANHFGDPERFWSLFIYCSAGLALLYLLKFVILKITGWIFNISRTVDTYLFVVFMTNKIIGIFLLPFLVIISFSGPVMTEIAITVSIIMICLFYVYRFIASYGTLHKEIKISGLHYFLYLCAFEIAPLLLIYKVLLSYLEKA